MGYNAWTMNYIGEIMGFSHVVNTQMLSYELFISDNRLNCKI